MTHKRQRGQAMVFGLLFMGIALIALILLFNQGILTRKTPPTLRPIPRLNCLPATRI
jgi:hypothetical protein